MVILYPLSEFIDSDRAVISEVSASYYYEGCCPESGERLRLPRTAMAEAIATGLMQQLANNDRYSIEGKMYGILLVKLPDGEQRVLKAFSGLLNGCSVVEGWVSPIPGRDAVALEEAQTLVELDAIARELITLKQLKERQEYETLSKEFDRQLLELSDRHQQSKQQRHSKRQILCEMLSGETLAVALEQLDEESRRDGIERRRLKRQHSEALQPLKQAIDRADMQVHSLKKRRKELSRQLQTQMHAAYSLTNFLGQSLSLQQLIPGGSIPTGTGDCCAPKLLHYAATYGLKPLAMAEFWWGNSSGDRDKIQGKFYEACTERCQPLMGFLLSGLSQKKIEKYSILPPVETFAFLFHATSLQGASFFSYKSIMLPNRVRSMGLTEEECGAAKASHSLPIIYQDQWLIAVNKPAFLLSVPGRGRDRFDSVLSRLRQLLDTQTLMAVHRLDWETSGILLLARDIDTYRHLSQQFQQRQVGKIYEAVLSGIVGVEFGTIELPLWGDPQNRPYQKVDEKRGKLSLTRFQVMAREGDCTRVEFMPLTGRTHQLRVHSVDMRGLGIPILGDRLYGCCRDTSRLHLHARELSFEHPHSRQTLHLHSKTPF